LRSDKGASSATRDCGARLALGRGERRRKLKQSQAEASAPVARVTFVLAKVTKTVFARRDPVR
ncbi:hypothetical protein VDF98_02080, partial [Xanthomonas campestris pv. raphani]